MTADYIAFHAAERPDAIAVITDGREISYAQFSRDIRKLTRALREFELPRGAKVMIHVEDEYFRWLLLLACERLCVVTLAAPQLSVIQAPLQQYHVEAARFFDFALTEKKLPAESIRRQYETTPEWLQGVLAREDKSEESMPAQGPDDPLRILLTSGTTGIPKKLLYSRRVHEGSVTKMMWFANFTPQSRYLGEGNVAAPTACMRAGGTVVFKNSPRMTAEETIVSHSITHIMLTPIVLKRLLDELPSGFAKRTGLKVFSSGAALSTALRDQARARLASEVYDIYGSYEAGYVSSIGDGGEIGSVWPGVQVQVVSDHDEPMPLGEMGRIRVKTDRMVQGYLDDPEATGRMFKDGWFYAQDSGILHGGHRLQVIGRSDDMINISGSKISPNMLEDLISKIDGIGDVGVCSILNTDGIEEIFIAAVAGAQVSNQELAARIKRALALGAWPYGRVHTFRVSQVPRTTNGKIQRKVLQNTLAGLRSALS